MNYNRRKFLRMGGNAALALAILPAAACNFGSAEKKAEEGSTAGTLEDDVAVLTKFGLQLYTLRDDLPKDPKGVLKQVASFGYKQIEGYEGPQGLFWNMTHTDFKKYMDDLGTEFIASHCNIDKDFEQKAAQAAEIGMKYLICPWKGPQKSLDDYKKIADDFNVKGEICKKNGIRFAYHNHDYTFKQVEGQFPQDILMKGTDPNLVDFEMDIYWVVTAGQDAEQWMKNYKNRFRSCHVKDRTKNATEAADSCTLGKGSIDFAKILKTAKATGMQYYIVEQEKYTGTTPLEAVKENAEYMKQLKF